jgi:hypothetical protein
MRIGKVGSMLAPALFVLNLPVALARAPGKIIFGSIGNYACVDVGQCNDGRVGISFVGGCSNNNQWGQQCLRPH